MASANLLLIACIVLGCIISTFGRAYIIRRRELSIFWRLILAAIFIEIALQAVGALSLPVGPVLRWGAVLRYGLIGLAVLKLVRAIWSDGKAVTKQPTAAERGPEGQ